MTSPERLWAAFPGVRPRAAGPEDDGSLAFWREAHRAAFIRELERSGRSPWPDMSVVCERFEVVFPG